MSDGKTGKLSDVLDDKTTKVNSNAHLPKNVALLTADDGKDVYYPGPKLTKQSLQEVTTGSLRLPKNGHPDYSYAWLPTDPRLKPSLQDAIGTRGYSICSIAELPEMADYVFNQSDNSLTAGKVVFKEMVLCKQHKHDRFLILEQYHHTEPTEQAASVYRNFNSVLAETSSRGATRPLSSENRSGDFTDNLEERLLNNNGKNTAPEDYGLITEGREVRAVRPKFDI